MAADAGLRDRIWVEVENLSEVVQRDKINPLDLVLYLNGQELKGIKTAAIEGPKQNWLAFDLKRTKDSDPAWRSLLGSPSSAFREVTVSVGFPDKQAIPTTPGKPRQPRVMYLRLYYTRWVVISLAFLILLVFLFVRRARKGGFIRDSNPPNPAQGKQKPYSLALTQVAWWFFLVLGSFGFIYMITGDYNTITDQALILMGIGTGTALGAFMINGMKRDTADLELSMLRPEKAKLEAEVKDLAAKDEMLKNKAAGADATTADQLAVRDNAVALAEKQAKLAEVDNKIADAQSGLSNPTSEGFTKDLLTDVNGLTLHRFQMLVWTIVLGIIFCIGVYRNLAMPEFSVTLLALMGISAGTYLGFKIPERQTNPKTEEKPK
jgi:hypothetical protein